MRSGRVGLPDDAPDLGDFLHQVQLCRQAASRIRQDDVDAARPGGGDGVKDHRRRVAGLLRDYRHMVAFAPGLQLLARGGAEGVAGCQQDRSALCLKMLGQLADRGRLAGAVDAGNHDDERAVRGQVERFFERPQEFVENLGQRALNLLRGVEPVAFGAHFQLIEQMLGCIEADVAAQ